MSWADIVKQFAQPVDPITKPVVPSTHKQCKGCDRLLPREQFYAKGQGGVSSRCKPCYIEYQNRKKEKRNENI